jgi:hypothetical protein
VSFIEILAVKDTQAIEDKALKIVNTALLKSDRKKHAFCGAGSPLAMNLVLTIRLYDDNAELEGFLLIINKALEFIGLYISKLSEP